MPQDIETEAQAFAQRYAALFSSPSCSSSDGVAQIADEVGKHYRPGVTFFTNGVISRFTVSSLSVGVQAGLTRRRANRNLRA